MLTQDLVNNFKAKMTGIQSHIQDAFTINNSSYIFSKDFRDFVVEASVVKIYIAWETFLEDCFTGYSMHQPSISGMHYVRYTTPVDDSHARKMAIGTQSFIEWGNPDTVIKLCSLYFDSGEPFKSVIMGVFTDLLDLRNVRNAAAHLSSTTQNKLEAVATRTLGIPSSGITVPDFVLAIHPRGTANETILSYYTRMLDAAVTAISR